MFPNQGFRPGVSTGAFGNRNRMSGLYGIGIGMGQAARAGQANPNPLSQVKPQQAGMANSQGIQQALQKAGIAPRSSAAAARSNTVDVLFAALSKLAEVQTGGSSAAGASTTSISSPGKGSMSSGMGSTFGAGAQQGQKPGGVGGQGSQAGGGGGMSGTPGMGGGNVGGQGRIGAFGIVRPGWNALSPNPPGVAAGFGNQNQGVKRAALQPQIGTTANAPMPPGPPGMAQQAPPGLPPVPPPNGGAPVPQGMGQPGIDPATGQPTQPMQHGTPPGQPPGQEAQQPGMPQAMNPQTGQPLTSPMQDAPPAPLPMNPQMAPPRAPTPHDNYGGNVIAGLGADMHAADAPTNAVDAQEDMTSEAMAMGSKTADLKNTYWNGGLPAAFLSQLYKELGEKAAGCDAYSFDSEDCPHCKASMEGDSYTGKCNSCGEVWGTKTAGSKLRSMFSLVPSPGMSFPGRVRQDAMLGGKKVGYMTLKDLPGGGKAVGGTYLEPQFRGMGLGHKMYGEVMKQYGRLSSDYALTPDAQRIWTGMAGRPGYGGVARAGKTKLHENGTLTSVPSHDIPHLEPVFSASAPFAKFKKTASFGRLAFAGAAGAGTLFGAAQGFSWADNMAKKHVGKDWKSRALAKVASEKEAGLGQMLRDLLGKAKPPAGPLSSSQVQANVPKAVWDRIPIFTDVKPDASGAVSSARHGAAPDSRIVRRALDLFATRKGLGKPDSATAGYSAGPGAEFRHIATSGGPGQERVLRHEGHHGVTNLLRGGVPRSEVPGAHWSNTAAARMQDSSWGGVRALGHHADEIGARAVGEGGVRGALAGAGHAVMPGAYYGRLAKESPAMAKAIVGGGAATIGAGGVGLGAGALEAAEPGSLRKVMSKVSTDLTPFAQGFFEACDAAGIPRESAVEKVGSEYGEEARAELLDGLEKTAGKFDVVKVFGGKAVDFTRGLFGGAPKPTPGVAAQGAHTLRQANPGLSRADALNQARQAPNVQSAQRALAPQPWQAGNRINQQVGNVARGAAPLGRQALSTAGGASVGGMAGDDLGMGGDSTDLGFVQLNNRGMMAGAAASNPFLRRRANNNLGGAASVPMAGMRNAGIGSFAGSGVDSAADAVGIDTGGRFGQMGAWGGVGLGMGRRGMQLGNKATGGTIDPLRRAAVGMRKGEQGLNNVQQGLFDPLVGGAKAMVRKPIQWASGGKYNGPGWAQPSAAANLTPGRVGGRIVGGVGLAGTGIGTGYGMAQDRIAQTVDDNVDRTLGERIPELEDRFAGFLDEYGQSRGMMDEDGQFDPMANSNRKGGILGNAMRGSDAIFQGMGMDPSRMTPLQKIMILGGAGAAGGGALAGAPFLAGAGGVSAAAGLLPYLMPSQSQGQMGPQQAPYAPGKAQQQPGLPFGGQPGYQNRDEWRQQGGGEG